MYGQRDEPYAVLSRLGRRLESTPAPGAAVLPTIVETVAGAIKAPHARISLKLEESRRESKRVEEGFETAAEHAGPQGGAAGAAARLQQRDRRPAGNFPAAEGRTLHARRSWAP